MRFPRSLVKATRLVLAIAGMACLMGQNCFSAAPEVGGTGDPYGTWSSGLTIVTEVNYNELREGTTFLESWTFSQQNGQAVLNMTSGSTAGTATGTLTTTEGGFTFVGESSSFDSLGIHTTLTINATFVGPNNIEGTKRTDFYSVSAVWLGVEPQFIGFESATFSAQRG